MPYLEKIVTLQSEYAPVCQWSIDIRLALAFGDIFSNIMIKIAKISLIVLLTLSSCANEFNAVYKMTDNDYKYEFAKQCYAEGKFAAAATLLNEQILVQKGTDNAEECLYMYAMSEYCNGDYSAASEAFTKYVKTYPTGKYVEQAAYNKGEGLFISAPEPRLDQTGTYSAISAFQDYLDRFPYGKYKEKAQNRLFELQDKLVEKEYLNAKMYYTLGSYFGNCTSGGNNYEACIVTAQNAIKDYPYNKHREDLMVLIMKSKFGLAKQSVEAKRTERYRDAEDECYGFINEFPDSKNVQLANEYIDACKKVIAKSKVPLYDE